MGCTGDREKASPLESQKWAYITLSDFHTTSSFQYFAYVWLWFMAFVGVAVYAVDTFTAVNLLAFDKWSSQIKPEVPLKYSKWIFAACILFSWALVIYEWIRAVRVIKRGGIAESYMDYLAANAQCMRSQGWKRFLVFSALTNSKKKVDYVAFFVYFAFQHAIRIILAEGPRQVVNAITLYSVMDAKVLVHDKTKAGTSPVEQFFLNIEALADENKQQTVILFSMLFTLILWVISALCLLTAILLYLLFLWHHIPQQDGRLSVYCRRKIDKRLEKIVEKKVQAAIEDEERKQRKLEAKMARKEDRPTQPIRQPTLPQIGGTSPNVAAGQETAKFGLSRADTSNTVSTLPLYSTEPPTPSGIASLQRQPTLPDVGGERPEMPSRTATQASNFSTMSYDSNAPLLANAGYAGASLPPVRPTAVSRQNSNMSFDRPVPPLRSMTASSLAGSRAQTPIYGRVASGQSRPGTSHSQRAYPPGPPVRTNTGYSYNQDLESSRSPVSPVNANESSYAMPRYQSPIPMARQASQASSSNRPPPKMQRQQTFGSLHSQQSSFSRPSTSSRKLSQGSIRSQQVPGRPSPYAPVSYDRPFSPLADTPIPGEDSYEMTHQPSRSIQYANGPSNGASPYTAYASIPKNPHERGSGLPRSLTPASHMAAKPHPTHGVDPMREPDDYFGNVPAVQERSAAYANDSQSRVVSGYGDILDDYDTGGVAHSTAPPPSQASRTAFSQYPPSSGFDDSLRHDRDGRRR